MFVDYYQQTRGALAGQVNGSISLVPVSGQSAWVNGQRAYNSSNTSDIVTIGSLQASTDVVHRSGDETVNGSKGFAGELYVPGVFTYKTKLFSGNNNYGGKYNRIAVLTPGSLGGAVVGMIWSSKGHNSTFRNRNGIIYMRARPSSGLLDFIWMVKGSGVANEQLALTYNGTNVELWGLCDTDSANESLIFSLMSEANSGGSATNIFTIAEDSVKTRAEIVAYNNYAFSG